MEIGIIGLPNCGKTTILNALTRGKARISDYASTRVEANHAVAKVPDARLDALISMFHPKKWTPAEVTYVDVAGLTRQPGSRGLGETFIVHIRPATALALVLRSFEEGSATHPTPLEDLKDVETELIITDLVTVEKRLDRVELDLKKGMKELHEERDALVACKEALDAGSPIRNIGLKEPQRKLLRGYQLLTAKPLLVIVNVGENLIGTDASVPIREHLKPSIEQHTAGVVEICGKLEMELAQLEPTDAKAFMEELGLKELALERVIRASYDLLGLISFFTTVSDEVRAWTIPRDTTAQRAAGAVHTDMERGFIRAEIIAFDTLMECGSLAAAREKGLLRIEGKDYVMQDGDIANFRFKV